MLNSTARNKIISSYAIVLRDILNKSQDCFGDLLKLEEAIKKLGSLSNFAVNPLIFNAYKHFLSQMEKTVEKNNEIEHFLNEILKRRYLYLLKDIVEKTKEEIQKQNKTSRIVILSNQELNENIKEQIKNIIYKQIGEREICYKIDRRRKTGTIDFLSNWKIGSIDLQNVIDKYLDTK